VRGCLELEVVFTGKNIFLRIEKFPCNRLWLESVFQAFPIVYMNLGDLAMKPRVSSEVGLGITIVMLIADHVGRILSSQNQNHETSLPPV
jgi:hypothetical protein